MSNLQFEIKKRIQTAQRVLVVSHIHPDGDAIGSMLAIGHAIQDSGKEVQMVLSDGLPSTFKHLPGSEQIKVKAEGKFDLIIALDCAEMKRTGTALDGYRKPDIVIDHHITGEAFGSLNLIEPEAVATASILTRYMQDWDLTITAPVAANLLTGLVTDTLGFRTFNTTPEVLRQASNLIEAGANMSTLYYQGLVRRTLSSARYWGAGLSNLKQLDGIIYTTLTCENRKISGYSGEDDADLINIISSIDDSEVAIIFIEQNNGKVKVSWRGLKPNVDVSKIAKQFGGGGHKAAAGTEIYGTLVQLQKRVLDATRLVLNSKKSEKAKDSVKNCQNSGGNQNGKPRN